MHSGFYHIPPSQSFAQTLAMGIISRYGDHPERLAETRVILPSQRAIPTLRTAFQKIAEQSGHQATLLPRMIAIADIEMLQQEVLGNAAYAKDSPDVKVIGNTNRVLMLARLIRQWQQQTPHAVSIANVVLLAEALADFIDQLQKARQPVSAIRHIVPEALAEHWQHSLQFLNIIAEHWHPMLEQHGWQEPIAMHNAVLEQITRWFRDTPPPFPVIIAGTTGSIPSTAEFIATVRRLTHGHVVLPGLDTHCPDTYWEAVREDNCHPQHGLARLLKHCGLTRNDVENWHYTPAAPTQHERELAVSCLMHPANTASPETGINPSNAFSAIEMLECATTLEEARTIALRLRKALESPGYTAMLVTHDRVLARQVQVMLERFGITADDSAGTPLNRLSAGSFLLLLWQAWTNRLSPVPLLAILKHPLAQLGYPAAADLRRLARSLETTALRGIRSYHSLAQLRQQILLIEDSDTNALVDLVDRLSMALQPLEALRAAPRKPLSDWIRAHMKVTETLSRDLHGKPRIWEHAGGTETAALIQELLESTSQTGDISAQEYHNILRHFLQRSLYRPVYGTEKRLRILSPIEARMQQADLVILAGMNEEVWPQKITTDPWLNRSMRESLGLTPPEQEIGLSAHDFCQLLCSNARVMITRSLKREGTPTMPSRWLLRIKSWLERHGNETRLEAKNPWNHWANTLIMPATISSIAPPSPCPPVDARPRRFYVTQIATLLLDPYGFYAKHILKLRPLDPLDMPPGRMDFGNWLHVVLQRFVDEYVTANIPYDRQTLLSIGLEEKEKLVLPATVWQLWWPRFEPIADWVVQQEMSLPPGKHYTECKGVMTLGIEGEEYTLSAYADRITVTGDGRVLLLDYKTGRAPGNNEMLSGFAPQLPLEGIIAEQGGFGPGITTPTDMEHWRLTGGDPAGEVKPLTSCEQAMEAARTGLQTLLAHYHQEHTPYPPEPFAQKLPAYSDYRHLARIKEWNQ